MKKLMAIALTVVMLIALFAVVGSVSASPPDASERTVFETVLVPNLQNVPGEGFYESVTLDEGEVKVYADGGWEVKIKGLRVDGELFTEYLDVLFWNSSRVVTGIDILHVVDGEGTLEVQAGDTDSIPAGEYPGVHVFLTHGGIAWLVESGVIIEESP